MLAVVWSSLPSRARTFAWSIALSARSYSTLNVPKKSLVWIRLQGCE
jgi:hypothetical protein